MKLSHDLGAIRRGGVAPDREPIRGGRSTGQEAEMNDTDFSGLSRPVHRMPDFVLDALNEHGLYEAYRSRPAYQQNDYIGWIRRAKRPETKEKRLDQMLDELRSGDVYRKMDYRPSREPR